MNVDFESLDPTVREKAALLDKLAMRYETAVQVLPGAGYLEAFFDFYEVKNRGHRLVPAEGTFRAALRELSGDDVFTPIADLTEELFGTPERVLVFEDDTALRDELEGPDGLGPLFFIFGILFCEYGSFTLCFISGTNN